MHIHRAAVYFEMGQYDRCMEDCDRAVERGREVRADYKLVAKAMQRKGSALVKLDRYKYVCFVCVCVCVCVRERERERER
jgi:hypothetical protein